MYFAWYHVIDSFGGKDGHGHNEDATAKVLLARSLGATGSGGCWER